MEECNHNEFGDAALQILVRLYANDSASYANLGDWHNSGKLSNGSHPGEESLASNPLFANGSGTMSDPADFRVSQDSPCTGTGTNGNDMGADINQVGIVAH